MAIVSADERSIVDAVNLLRQGGLVALPTETVYGLGADAKNTEAVKKIFAAKGRPADHPLIVHIPDKSELEAWAVDIPESAWILADRFWPGPLTVVLKKHPDVPAEVTGGQPTVALRVPNHPVALKVLKVFGGGIAAPSANRFCRISPTQASHVEEELGDKVDLILDGGSCQVGLESTIVDLSNNQPRLLRPGQICKSEIESVLEEPLQLPVADEKIHAPGAMDVHYAPVTTTILCSQEQIKNFGTLNSDPKIGLLSFTGGNIRSFRKAVPMPVSFVDYGKALYANLRTLDHEGLDIILVEQPPQTEEWRGVNDRLTKAAQSFDVFMSAKRNEN